MSAGEPGGAGGRPPSDEQGMSAGGGGGMAAALTAHDAGLKPLIIEKGKKFGGSTALSGGGIWIPNNPTLKARGHDDSRESIRRYLDLLTQGKVPAARLDAYVDNGP